MVFEILIGAISLNANYKGGKKNSTASRDLFRESIWICGLVGMDQPNIRYILNFYFTGIESCGHNVSHGHNISRFRTSCVRPVCFST